MAVHLASRDIRNLPLERGRSGHMHGVAGIKQVRDNLRIHRIDRPDTVDSEGVAIEIRLERIRSNRPNALVVLHRQSRRARHGEKHLFRIRSPETERNAIIRVDFRRNQRRRLLLAEHGQQGDREY